MANKMGTQGNSKTQDGFIGNGQQDGTQGNSKPQDGFIENGQQDVAQGNGQSRNGSRVQSHEALQVSDYFQGKNERESEKFLQDVDRSPKKIEGQGYEGIQDIHHSQERVLCLCQSQEGIKVSKTFTKDFNHGQGVV